VAAESQRGGAGGDPEGGARHGRLRFEGAGGGLSAQSTSRRDGSDRARREGWKRRGDGGEKQRRR
jgi:hypothetical protein